MGQIQDYENASGEIEKALTALVVAERKNANARAWNWARIAAEHAEAVGVQNAYDLLGNGRRPELEPLRAALEALESEIPVVFYPDGYYMPFRPGVTRDEAMRHVVERFRYVAIRPVSSNWLDSQEFAAEFDRLLEEMVGPKEAKRLRRH